MDFYLKPVELYKECKFKALMHWLYFSDMEAMFSYHTVYNGCG